MSNDFFHFVIQAVSFSPFRSQKRGKGTTYLLNQNRQYLLREKLSK